MAYISNSSVKLTRGLRKLQYRGEFLESMNDHSIWISGRVLNINSRCLCLVYRGHVIVFDISMPHLTHNRVEPGEWEFSHQVEK
ncbi:hypothetical protein AgCh_026417 [Apium graveolens]